MKYELDREPGLLNLDRVLYTTQNQFQNIDELPKHVFHEMAHFFSVYKAVERKETVVDEVQPRDVALLVMEETINSYAEHFCKYC